MFRNVLLLGVIILVVVVHLAYMWRGACRNRVLNMVMTMDPHAQTVLDLGCGSCCNTVQLSKMGKRVVSMDIVDKGVCTKPQLFDGDRIPYGDKTFDLGICSFVLHHTSTYLHILRELKRTCRRILVIENTPEIGWDWLFTKAHASSEWGECEGCFKNTAMWEHEFNYLDLNVLQKQRISRWTCPFGDKPWFYPVPSTAYLLAAAE